MSPGSLCPKCGAPNAPGASFCSVCGTSLAATPPQQPQWPPQQPYPGMQQPPAQYPPQPQAPQSNKALIALILGVVGFLMCGPFTAIPGIFIAKSELDGIKSGALPPTNKQMAEIAFWINIAVTAIYVLGICAFFALFGGLGVLGGLSSMG